MTFYIYSEKLFVESLTNEQKLFLKHCLDGEVQLYPKTNLKIVYNTLRKNLKKLNKEEMTNLEDTVNNQFAREAWEL